MWRKTIKYILYNLITYCTAVKNIVFSPDLKTVWADLRSSGSLFDR